MHAPSGLMTRQISRCVPASWKSLDSTFRSGSAALMRLPSCDCDKLRHTAWIRGVHDIVCRAIHIKPGSCDSRSVCVHHFHRSSRVESEHSTKSAPRRLVDEDRCSSILLPGPPQNLRQVTSTDSSRSNLGSEPSQKQS